MRKYIVLLVTLIFVVGCGSVQKSTDTQDTPAVSPIVVPSQDEDVQAIDLPFIPADADNEQRLELKEVGLSLVIPSGDWGTEIDPDPATPPLATIFHQSGQGVIFLAGIEDERPLVKILAESKEDLAKGGVKATDVKIEKNPERASLVFDFKADGNAAKAKLVFMRHPSKSKLVIAFLGMAEPEEFKDLMSALDTVLFSLKPL